MIKTEVNAGKFTFRNLFFTSLSKQGAMFFKQQTFCIIFFVHAISLRKDNSIYKHTLKAEKVIRISLHRRLVVHNTSPALSDFPVTRTDVQNDLKTTSY